ncbi:MAG TPA: glutathione S-transferase C-terminal domain-containing protein, partial [Novosphingobium sp.]
AILDWLDELAGCERALIPASGPGRRHVLKVCALATGLADKAVSLVYERVVHGRATPVWAARCEQQIAGVLDELERDRTGRGWWGGDALGHADIAVACVLRFVREAHPQLFHADRWPALAAHSDACEAMAAFSGVIQPFHITPPQH